MKAMDQGATAIGGSWTHSFEEDEGGVLTYRPTHTFAFPPSRRGREILEFGEGGELTEQTPGPDDRPRATEAGRWRALGMNRYGVGGMSGAPAQVLEIVEATSEILKVRKF